MGEKDREVVKCPSCNRDTLVHDLLVCKSCGEPMRNLKEQPTCKGCSDVERYCDYCCEPMHSGCMAKLPGKFICQVCASHQPEVLYPKVFGTPKPEEDFPDTFNMQPGNILLIHRDGKPLAGILMADDGTLSFKVAP